MSDRDGPRRRRPPESVPRREGHRDAPCRPNAGDRAGRRSSVGLLTTALLAVLVTTALAAATAQVGAGSVTDQDGDGESPASAGVTDTDGDGLTDERERRIGTDPDDPDTDGDGLTDGLEVDGEPGAEDLAVRADRSP